MTETYEPFDAGAGANVTESGWDSMARLWLPNGVSLNADAGGSLTALQAFGDSSGMQVKLPAGAAWIDGSFYNNSAQQTLAIGANASGNPRIDRVIITRSASGNTVTASILQGTPAGSPVAPSLTQSPGGTYQISVAQVAVGNGAATITAANVTDERPIAQGIDGGTGSMVKLFDSTLGAAGTFDCQNIPQTFAHLRVEMMVRSNTATTAEQFYVRFNNDSGANYIRQELYAKQAVVSAGQSGGNTGSVLGDNGGSTAGDTTVWSGGVLDIPGYATANKKIGVSLIAGYNNTVTDGFIEAFAHRWNSTAAINRIQMQSAAGANFVTASRMTVYGIR